MSNHFYVVLPSGASLEAFPNNTLSSYTTLLHKPIDLNDGYRYEVALCEVQIAARFQNFAEDTIIGYIDKTDKTKAKKMVPVILKRGHYTDITQIINSVRESLKPIKIGVKLINAEENLFSFIMSRKSKEILEFSFLPIYEYKKMFERIAVAKYTKVFRFNNSELPTPPSQAYIYTDIIDHNYVGDSQTRLLRTVQFPDKELNQYSHNVAYNNLYYMKLSKEIISQIKINIRTVTGDLFPFSPGHLTLQLHFRAVEAI